MIQGIVKKLKRMYDRIPGPWALKKIMFLVLVFGTMIVGASSIVDLISYDLKGEILHEIFFLYVLVDLLQYAYEEYVKEKAKKQKAQGAIP